MNGLPFACLQRGPLGRNLDFEFVLRWKSCGSHSAISRTGRLAFCLQTFAETSCGFTRGLLNGDLLAVIDRRYNSVAVIDRRYNKVATCLRRAVLHVL